MNSSVKIKSKMLLKGDTLRLFFVSLFSFIIRRGVFALGFYCLFSMIKNGVLEYYLDNFNDALVFGLVIFDTIFVIMVLMLFVSALRLGEQFLYFIKASGGKGRFSLLFHFFTFEKSFRAFLLYMKLTVLKVTWLIYFLFPCVVCYGITFYLYSYGNLLPAVFYILIIGSSVLLSFCVFMWRVTFFRYNAAPYYICLNRDITPKAAIQKSIHFTDGVLRESVLLESSFLGWFLSCGVLFPFVYVIPYFKIAKALFVVESMSLKAYPKTNTRYAINYIGLK